MSTGAFAAIDFPFYTMFFLHDSKVAIFWTGMSFYFSYPKQWKIRIYNTSETHISVIYFLWFFINYLWNMLGNMTIFREFTPQDATVSCAIEILRRYGNFKTILISLLISICLGTITLKICENIIFCHRTSCINMDTYF